MAKIKIKATLKNQTDQDQIEIETVGIQNGNHIFYSEKDVQMHLWIDQNKIRIKRIQKDAQLEYQYIKSLTTEGIYDIKSVNMKIPIKIVTKKLQIHSQAITIVYTMTLADTTLKEFCYQLTYEVIP